jgi:hypothetical protein
MTKNTEPSSVVRVDFRKPVCVHAKPKIQAKTAVRAERRSSELLAHSIVRDVLTTYKIR